MPVPKGRTTTSIKIIADELGLETGLVRDVLRESAPPGATKEVQDRIFQAARRLGYDFRKLKIGKRMHYRKETLDEVIEKLAQNPGWGRAEIVKYLQECRGLVDRVHERVFRDEYGKSPGR